MADESSVGMATPEMRDRLVTYLKGRSRRDRQEASHALAAMAREDATLLVEVAQPLIEALELPEAQTRWECLDALSCIALVNAEVILGAFEGAEEALFDEGSAAVRLSAFRYLCRYGAGDAARSREVWPLVSEAVQCFHGDPEYREMLICLLDLAQGDIDAEVGEELAKRMAFDAKNGRGFIKAYSTEIRAAVAKEA